MTLIQAAHTVGLVSTNLDGSKESQGQLPRIALCIGTSGNMPLGGPWRSLVDPLSVLTSWVNAISSNRVVWSADHCKHQDVWLGDSKKIKK